MLSANMPALCSSKVVTIWRASDTSAALASYAAAAGIPSLVVEKKRDLGDDEFSKAVFGPCRKAGVRYVVMGGFLKHVLIPPDFDKRVINIHPALLPAFGGKGMYGLNVHAEVLKAREKISGCTVHFVDNEYDHGPVILQRQVAVLPGDTAETLQSRVFAAECEAYPAALRQLAAL